MRKLIVMLTLLVLITAGCTEDISTTLPGNTKMAFEIKNIDTFIQDVQALADFAGEDAPTEMDELLEIKDLQIEDTPLLLIQLKGDTAPKDPITLIQAQNEEALIAFCESKGYESLNLGLYYAFGRDINIEYFDLENTLDISDLKQKYSENLYFYFDLKEEIADGMEELRDELYSDDMPAISHLILNDFVSLAESLEFLTGNVGFSNAEFSAHGQFSLSENAKDIKSLKLMKEGKPLSDFTKYLPEDYLITGLANGTQDVLKELIQEVIELAKSGESELAELDELASLLEEFDPDQMDSEFASFAIDMGIQQKALFEMMGGGEPSGPILNIKVVSVIDNPMPGAYLDSLKAENYEIMGSLEKKEYEGMNYAEVTIDLVKYMNNMGQFEMAAQFEAISSIIGDLKFFYAENNGKVYVVSGLSLMDLKDIVDTDSVGAITTATVTPYEYIQDNANFYVRLNPAKMVELMAMFTGMEYEYGVIFEGAMSIDTEKIEFSGVAKLEENIFQLLQTL